MPTYQYACTACGHEFEQFQSFSDAALTECPMCGGKLRKVYGSVGVVFKGSGFYRTDSRNGDGKVAAESAPAKAAESSGTSGKTEKAPAAAAGSGSNGTTSSTSGGTSNGSTTTAKSTSSSSTSGSSGSAS